jgi:hypothetical protein
MTWDGWAFRLLRPRGQLEFLSSATRYRSRPLVLQSNETKLFKALHIRVVLYCLHIHMIHQMRKPRAVLVFRCVLRNQV